MSENSHVMPGEFFMFEFFVGSVPSKIACHDILKHMEKNDLSFDLH